MTHANNINERYGTKILAQGIEVPAYETGLSPCDIIIGGTGSGKTSGFCIPNLMNATGSLVVTDTKGILYRQFKKYFEDKGYEVAVLDFVNPYNSCGFNPINFIRRHSDGTPYEQDIVSIATAIMPDLDPHEPFWQKSGISEICLVISYMLDILPPEEQNMYSICELHRAICREKGEMDLRWHIKDNPGSFTAKKYDEINQSKDADRTRACIKSFVNEALAPYKTKEARNIFCQKPYDFSKLGKQPTVLFINISDTDTSFDHTVNFCIQYLLMHLVRQADANENGKLDVPVRFILDDFCAGTKIDNFDRIVSTIRSRDISCSIIVQSLSQLEYRYGSNAAETIIDNMGYILFLGGGQVGKTSEFIAYRAYTSPEEVMCMPRDKVYIIKQGERAFIADKILPGSYSPTASKSQSFELATL